MSKATRKQGWAVDGIKKAYARYISWNIAEDSGR